MHSAVTVTPAHLPGLLLHVAVARPVFVWGAPGIGKSSLVRDFAASLGLDCVTLVGTQLAAEDADDFPPAGPILVITDGDCDALRIRRAHAFLMPRGARLPFTPRGPVLHLS
ncbi:hypothetical protein Adi01nite_45160 [Amorphoplanes digitatis]|uniref:Uncharacterized protein n=1 Tax=Actinoplanes digitatis TaxID=1868 RepID=A0A7W7MNQ2_9ACTN|nr:hypothetical protein [Actinoplanes digitatis]MBB4760912.1 hypothetical protein [Actinoplanes digitatis]BFE69206.1 hypothetical protein GCM10020092_025070 [Actinoplanes digitatis]GID95104.1 hypothetical protein Adi01nite_45160 [Actinoplanes digitatis]